jgi:hypothetical protein
MKIDRFSGPKTSSTRRGGAASPSGGGAFARALADTPEQVASPSGAGPVHALNALLSVQEVDSATEGRRRARRSAESLLDRLEDLRLAIMLGEVSVAQLERLSQQLAERREAGGDPKLAQIINEIEIRAAVELAKRGR